MLHLHTSQAPSGTLWAKSTEKTTSFIGVLSVTALQDGIHFYARIKYIYIYVTSWGSVGIYYVRGWVVQSVQNELLESSIKGDWEVKKIHQWRIFFTGQNACWVWLKYNKGTKETKNQKLLPYGALECTMKTHVSKGQKQRGCKWHESAVEKLRKVCINRVLI